MKYQKFQIGNIVTTRFTTDCCKVVGCSKFRDDDEFIVNILYNGKIIAIPEYEVVGVRFTLNDIEKFGFKKSRVEKIDSKRSKIIYESNSISGLKLIINRFEYKNILEDAFYLNIDSIHVEISKFKYIHELQNYIMLYNLKNSMVKNSTF